MKTETAKHQQRRPAHTEAPPVASAGLSRRGFLGRAGGVAAAAVAAGVLSGLPLGGSEVTTIEASDIGPVNDRVRAGQALAIRTQAAQNERAILLPPHPTNSDETLYANKIGNYSKGLPRNAANTLGEVDPAAYNALIGALELGQPAAFEGIPLGGTLLLSDPQSAYAFVLQGPDSHHLGMSAAPAFASAQEAAEAGEDYWMALARDVAFANYDTDATIAAACQDLGTNFSSYVGPIPVTPDSIFRGTTLNGTTPSDLVGPYLSQFLWQNVPYGALTMVQQYPPAAVNADYMTSYTDWLNIQQGGSPVPTVPTSSPPRYISSGRDLTAFLHKDFSYQACLNACLILQGLVGKSDVNGASVLDAGNPYLQSKTQSGFATFGAPHVLDLVATAANAALKACWFQKWLVHRRVRPEEYGGCVHFCKTGQATYPVHKDLLTKSTVLAAIYSKYGTYFLPQAYPEGCPAHPSYPAGHAAVAGACVTVLKAYFNEAYVLPNAVVASADGSMLNPYTGAQLTVGNELNKLASNIGLGRDFAGVHWRTDILTGLQLGEAVAIGILTDQRTGTTFNGAKVTAFNENFSGFSLTKFDGTMITV